MDFVTYFLKIFGPVVIVTNFTIPAVMMSSNENDVSLSFKNYTHKCLISRVDDIKNFLIFVRRDLFLLEMKRKNPSSYVKPGKIRLSQQVSSPRNPYYETEYSQ